MTYIEKTPNGHDGQNKKKAIGPKNDERID
jgi:hypothetical protein